MISGSTRPICGNLSEVKASTKDRLGGFGFFLFVALMVAAAIGYGQWETNKDKAESERRMAEIAASETKSSSSASSGRIRWTDEDSYLLADCIVDLVGIEYLGSEQGYERPVTLCLLLTNPGLPANGADFLYPCVAAAFSWEPSTVRSAASGIEEFCFSAYRGP